ncbi:DNA polymerase type-X family protein pol4 [Phlyctema vagabunda]|uniref:DNA polymerase n=1 Tax=Phlyctema vagabunda TaxID=108571 RepID=A0ABR4PNT9_9HELO
MAPTFPRIYLLKWRIPNDELLLLERKIPTLTYSIHEAQVVLGEVDKKERAAFELRKAKLWTEEITREQPLQVDSRTKRRRQYARQPGKRLRVEGLETGAREVITIDLSTDSDVDENTDSELSSGTRTPSKDTQSSPPPAFAASSGERQDSSRTELAEEQDAIDWGDTIKVLKVAWFKDSLEVGILLPVGPYLVYEGRVINQPTGTATESPVEKVKVNRTKSITSRAKVDAPLYLNQARVASKTWGISHKRSQQSITRPTHLLHQTTSEHEVVANLPDLPDWLHTKNSCERPTLLYSPNDPFLKQLKKIKQARRLDGNEVGVRAYSTIIASIAAYPFTITTVAEIRRLPGCDDKTAALYKEWKEYGRIQEVDEIDSDPKMAVLNEFWNTWGIADKTAIKLYNKGYRSLDDLVQYEWESLSRVQQIGVKYYDEFLEKIPRPEVEAIGAIILKHAQKVDSRFEMVIVGGYRRGKPESGDVDVILTHADEDVTSGFISGFVDKLGAAGWITHNLEMTDKNTQRGQEPLRWKGHTEATGSGFDTLDKALVVWQDLDWPTKEEDLASNPKMKNPNRHRRVDIIVTPWKTAGCAIIGWSGGTTFQRDLRLHCKARGLKFDSSGIRSRSDGRWMDFERGAHSLLDKEKKVFERLGLPWREPTERCTG